WSTTTDELRNRSEMMLSRFLVWNRFRRTFNSVTDHLLGLDRRVDCCRPSDITRQTNVEVKPILNIFRKELLLQVRSHEPAEQQEDKRTRQHQPPMLNGPAYQPIVETVETSLALFLYR